MSAAALRYGYTTGACAGAAAKGAALMLREQRLVEDVEIVLPGGETPCFRLHGQEFTEHFATCFVLKDAGDDPDVTNGAEVHARVTLADSGHSSSCKCGGPEGVSENVPPPFMGGGESFVVIEGGIGVGRVTKPGLAVPVGAWAINPVPRRMIEEAIKEIFPPGSSPLTPHVVLSIPNGEELAKKTLNARLGIVGGLSILGTTGIVKPVSAKAWTDTIDAAIDVALACGCETVVLSTGRTSEMAAQKLFAIGGDFPEEAYVMMGDHVGYSLRSCSRKGVRKVTVAGQFGKFLKIACGHDQTHVASSQLDLQMLAEWAAIANPGSRIPDYCLRANTARQVLEESGNDCGLIRLVCGKVFDFARLRAPETEIQVFLAGYRGEVLYCA